MVVVATGLQSYCFYADQFFAVAIVSVIGIVMLKVYLYTENSCFLTLLLLLYP